MIRLPSLRSQGCGRDPEEHHRAGPTKWALSDVPREERQGDDRDLEVGPQQDPPHLQRTSRRFRMTIANRQLPDRTCDKHKCGRFGHS